MYNFIRFFLWYKYDLQPYNIRFVYLVLIGTAAYFAANAIPVKFQFVIDLMIRSTVFSLLFLLPVYFFRVSKDLNKAADGYLRMFKIIR